MFGGVHVKKTCLPFAAPKTNLLRTRTLTSAHRLVALGPPSARVNRVATHRVRPIDAVQLKVQAARVADHLAAQIAAPDRRRQGAAVRAGHVLGLLLLLLLVRDVLR